MIQSSIRFSRVELRLRGCCKSLSRTWISTTAPSNLWLWPCSQSFATYLEFYQVCVLASHNILCLWHHLHRPCAESFGSSYSLAGYLGSSNVDVLRSRCSKCLRRAPAATQTIIIRFLCSTLQYQPGLAERLFGYVPKQTKLAEDR